MNTAHFNSLSVDELWIFHQEVAAKLTQKMLVQKAHLEERLHRIGLANEATRFNRERRPYPPVRPKYRNPKNPAERHGRVAAGCLDGCGRSFEPAENWTIS
ncbi:hypothetical protein ACVWXL_002243 [Bradyrhizobium sp. GM22.5]